MTTASASHDAVLDRLTADLDDVGRRLDRIRQGMTTLRLDEPSPAASSPTAGAAAEGPAPSGAPHQVHWADANPPVGAPPPAGATPAGPAGMAPAGMAPAGMAPAGMAPAGIAPAGMAPPPMPPPPPPTWAPPGVPPTGGQPAQRPVTERLSTEGLGARLLAITGAAVTLLGVVMLLVLAARNGWFSPPARVIGGAVLGLALVGAGVRVHHRDRTVAAIALTATGVAALYLDIAAASALYGYLSPAPALLAAAVVLTGGLVLADRWRHEGLALGVLVAGGILAPVAAQAVTPLVVGLLVVAQLVVAPLVRRRGWWRVLLAATVLATIDALIAQGAATGDALTDRIAVAVATLAVVAVAVGTALATRERLAPAVRGSALAIPMLALLGVAAVFDRFPAAAVIGGAALVLLGLAVARRHADPVVAQVAAAAAAVAGLDATLLALQGTAAAAVLLGQALVLAVLARRVGARGPLIAAGVYGLMGLGYALDRPLRPDAVTVFPSILVPVPAVRDVAVLVGSLVTSVLLVAAAAAILSALIRRLPDRRQRLAAVSGLGVLALYGATGAVVGAALLVSPTRTGFLTGHVLVTVSWTAVALVLLVRGLRDTSARALGGVLVVAAVVKLVLFDLVALDGFARVAAFLGAGIVLLAAGTRYARLVAAAPDAAAPSAPDTATPSGPGQAPPS